jgi:hypothetical protein
VRRRLASEKVCDGIHVPLDYNPIDPRAYRFRDLSKPWICDRVAKTEGRCIVRRGSWISDPMVGSESGTITNAYLIWAVGW